MENKQQRQATLAFLKIDMRHQDPLPNGPNWAVLVGIDPTHERLREVLRKLVTLGGLCSKSHVSTLTCHPPVDHRGWGVGYMGEYPAECVI